MIEIDIRTVTLVCSSLFAGIALLLNFRVARRSNRIAVSSKLTELSKLLSDELVARVEMHRLLEKELKEAKSYPDQAIAAEKVRSLQESLERNIKRQNELDSETDYLEKAFLNLDKVDIGGLDAKIARSYRMQRIAESTLSFAEKLKLQ
ncbi:MAG: hypothetical protein ACXWTH_03465 [Methylosarcina sp.]